MSVIMYAWELGGGLGHLMRIYPVLHELQQRGHRIAAAIRDQRHQVEAWPDLECPVFSAPFKKFPTATEINPIKYFSHILHNIGWGNLAELEPLLLKWHELYQRVQPDFVIHDHSPTALLVSQQLQIKHALLGTGFCSPPDKENTFLLRTWSKTTLDEESRANKHVLESVNRWLHKTQQPPINRPTEPFSRASENFLTTFKELDHFGPRVTEQYWGIPNAPKGIRPTWPSATGPKLFAYLKADKTLPGVIKIIHKLQLPTLIFLGNPGNINISEIESRFVHITSQPIDMEWVAQEAALGILNGSHGSTAAFLLAGKPILQLPIQLEQYWGAKKSVAIGAALMADRQLPATIESKLIRILSDAKFTANAQQFSCRYRNWTPRRQTNLIVDRIEQILRN